MTSADDFRGTLRKSLDIHPRTSVYLVLGVGCRDSCLVGVRERTVQFGGKELFGGYNC